MNKDRIYLSPPDIGSAEIEHVLEAFQSNWIAPAGPNLDAFEEDFAILVGSKHAVAVSSGTAALHLALRLAGVGPGDEVLCSSLTFIASAAPITYLGARVLNPLAYQLDLTDIRQWYYTMSDSDVF